MGWLHLLRVIHVGVGAFWAGAIVVFAFMLFPAIRAVGSAGGPVMEQLTSVRRLPQAMLGGALFTVLSGAALYWRDSGGFQGEWVRSGPGITFLSGGILGLLAAMVGAAVNAPVGKRLGEIGAQLRQAGGPPSPAQASEIERLQVRMSGALRLTAVLVLLALMAMSVARYVP
jgi:hypothetical protein